MYINMERVSRYAVITHTGWPYVPTEKVSALLYKTGWFTYKLAIGVQRGMFETPLQLRWTRQLKPGEYDPSLGELFDGITLESGQVYFLMVSNLHEGLKDVGIRDQHRRYFDEALWRYRQLYMPGSAPACPTGPSLIEYINQPSKTPPETPPDDEPAGGGHIRLKANLDALRLLITTRNV